MTLWGKYLVREVIKGKSKT